MDLLGKTPIGKTVDVVYIRDGEPRTTKLTTISKGDLDQLGRVFATRPQGRGRLGIDDQQEVQIPNSKLRGVKLGTVQASLPADMAGLKNGDIVLEFGGIPIRTEAELNHRIQRAIPYEIVDIVIMRGDERLTIPVKMGRRCRVELPEPCPFKIGHRGGGTPRPGAGVQQVGEASSSSESIRSSS